MAESRLSAMALTQHYLDRIAEVNPSLHAVIAVLPDALEQAAASDAAWQSGRPRGALEGIPVLVKDNVQVAGAPTTAGSPALLGVQPPDAFVVSRLRAAGAVILAKANLSEWANFRSTRSSSGWSTVGGQTANPYALDRNPSGSSSGSAAGVSAGLAALAVADAAVLLTAMAAADSDDLSVLGIADDDHPDRSHGGIDYTAFLDPAALEGARIGIWRAASVGADAVTAALLDVAVGCLRSFGAVVIDPVELPGIEKVTEPEFDALNYEFKHGINAYLKYIAEFAVGPGQAPPGTLAELIEFNEVHAERVLARFGQEIFYAAEATTGNLADPVYLELRRAANRLATSAVETPTVEHKLDAIFSLTANPAWLTDYILGDHNVFGTSRPGAVTGWPTISVPFGYVAGLPVGVSFLGPHWSEPRLLALAYAFEQATNHRRPPNLLPTISVNR